MPRLALFFDAMSGVKMLVHCIHDTIVPAITCLTLAFQFEPSFSYDGFGSSLRTIKETFKLLANVNIIKLSEFGISYDENLNLLQCLVPILEFFIYSVNAA